jgi:hypothetical protein
MTTKLKKHNRCVFHSANGRLAPTVQESNLRAAEAATVPM